VAPAGTPSTTATWASVCSPRSRGRRVPEEAGRPFEARVERRGAAVLVAFSGELDAAAARAAQTALSGALSESEGPVVVDLRALEYMDSTGLRCLLQAKCRADDAGRRMPVLNGGGPVDRVPSLSGADAVLEMIDDDEQLDPSIRGS
jgi:anti-anti-sigma factor